MGPDKGISSWLITTGINFINSGLGSKPLSFLYAMLMCKASMPRNKASGKVQRKTEALSAKYYCGFLVQI